MDEIRQGWSILTRFKWLVITTTLIGGLVAVGLTYVLSPVYVAVLPIRFKIGGNSSLIDTTQYIPLAVPTSKSFSDTYAQALKSRSLSEQVVDKLKLDQLKEDEGNWLKRLKTSVKDLYGMIKDYVLYGYHQDLPPREAVIRRLQGSLEARPINDSYIIEVGVAWSDPQLAALLVNTAADVFVQESRTIAGGDATTYRKYVEDQLARAQTDLDTAQKDLRDYQEKENIVSLPEQAKLDLQSLDSAQELLREVDLQISNSTQQLVTYRQQVDQLPKTVESQTAGQVKTQLSGKSADTSKAVTTIDNKTSEETNTNTQSNQNANASNQRSSAESDTSGKTNTQSNISGQQAQSNTGSTTRSEEQKGDTTSVTTYPNPTYQDIEKSILSLEAELKGLSAKRQDLVTLINNSQGRLTQFPEKTTRATRLELAVTASQNNYLKMKTEYSDALFREARQIGEISILSSAVPPTYPSRPIKGLYGAIGLAVGLLVGLIVASIITGFDTKLRTLLQVEEKLGIPVLATMPTLNQGTLYFYRRENHKDV